MGLMTEVEFHELFRSSQFNHGFIGMPILVSLSDRNRHFNFPPVGPFTFVFDEERKLQEWGPWNRGNDGSHSYNHGGLHATFKTTE